YPDSSEIRASMQRQSHRKWGFIIYHCTYASDSAWTRFMALLNQRARESLEEEDALDLLATLDLSARDDRVLFDGADKSSVRDHFNAWLTSEEAAAAAEQADAWGRPRGVLYAFPIHVDTAALESVVGESVDRPEEGYVNLINSYWAMPDPETYDFEGNGKVRGEDDPTDEGEEPVEGCRLWDVGWMKADIFDLVPGKYATLLQPGRYYTCYKRPPVV
ncbi:hypothetical protein K432DRAFT_251937, partial [Lepidopterella palustris CBS 459.81]